MESCIKACLECHDVCVKTLDSCIEKGNQNAYQKHIKLLMDCIDICRLSREFMLRGSDRHGITCYTCYQICQMCAEYCDMLSKDDPVMEDCAKKCYECAESCEEMSVGLGLLGLP